MAALLLNRFSAPDLSSLPAASIAGKTVLVTGSSAGLGLEAARHYARLGASRLILAVRSQARGDKAKQDILDSLDASGSKGNGPTIDVWLVDYNSFSSVQEFAKRVNHELDSLDIAVLNSGVTKPSYDLAPTGWEETLQVNVLSTTLLALLLLPKLRSSKQSQDWTPRLSIVASGAHKFVQPGFQAKAGGNLLEWLNKPENFGGFNARYSISKLLVIYTTIEIAKLATGPDGKPSVIVNYSCPGVCVSELGRLYMKSVVMKVVFLIFSIIAKTAEQGGRTIVKASCLDEGSQGKWFLNDAIEEPGILVTSEEGRALRKQVWGEILQILEAHEPGVREIAELNTV